MLSLRGAPRAIFTVAAFLFMANSAGAAELDHVLLFDSGRDGYPRYRIPALVVAPGGAVLAICEGRKDGGGLKGNIDLVIRRSTDSGQNWSPLAVLADEGDNTLGNPCVVVDAATKEVFVALTRSLGSDTEEGIVAGKSRERTRVLWTKSGNDGVDWSPPVDITATTTRDNWTWYGTGPGVGIQLKSGRLVMPSYHAELPTGTYRSHMLYSDDHGRNWKIGATVGEHTSECHVVERQDGSLYLNARTVQGRELRTIAHSTDGGETWSSASFDEQLYDSHCQACVIRLPAKGDASPAWLFTHPAGPSRYHLTARLSRDEGRTWPVAKRLREGNSQYSCLAVLPDGAIGCLYDCWVDGNYRLFFVRFPMTWLTGE